VTRIERKIWSPHHGSFIATGETMDVDLNTLEPEAKIPSGRFLRGPIPWSWIAAAAALPSRALLVGLCLWRLAGAVKSDTVSFGNSDLRQLGIERATKSRALRVLERAGLIKVARQPGRFPKVTLLGARCMFRTTGSSFSERFEQSAR
jgi:DNA-binding transcriptional ArsR family regulator